MTRGRLPDLIGGGEVGRQLRDQGRDIRTIGRMSEGRRDRTFLEITEAPGLVELRRQPRRCGTIASENVSQRTRRVPVAGIALPAECAEPSGECWGAGDEILVAD